MLFTPIFGAYLSAKNWKSIGFGERATLSMRWFYSWLVYYVTLPVTAPLLSATLPYPTLTEAIMIASPVGIWIALEGLPQLRYAKKEKAYLCLEKSWRIPLTVAFGVVFGVAGILVSAGIALTLVSLPI